MYVIVVHTADGPGNSRVFGLFDTQEEGTGAAPRVAAAVPRWEAVEVVEVQSLLTKPDDPDFTAPSD